MRHFFFLSALLLVSVVPLSGLTPSESLRLTQILTNYEIETGALRQSRENLKEEIRISKLNLIEKEEILQRKEAELLLKEQRLKELELLIQSLKEQLTDSMKIINDLESSLVWDRIKWAAIGIGSGLVVGLVIGLVAAH